MFKNTFQSGFLSILYSIGSKPLQIWDKKVRNGHIKRITDNDIQSLVLEIVGSNVSTTYITCPADPKKTLGIKLPFLVMIIKNLKKYFTFEVQHGAMSCKCLSSPGSSGDVWYPSWDSSKDMIPNLCTQQAVALMSRLILDDKNVRRRFRASNYQSTTRVKPFICTMPMRLDDGWNQIQFNLADFTRRAYGTNYIETLRVQIHANCRIRRVYFSDRLYSEDELPAEFKLFLPIQNKAKA
ncbi:cilia- and flagella-associated protein 20 isoform X1 [Schistocerca americana]|uniref:cilia- and flagella-associated protein 20 isoform X1 n=1 Tax=Schistocerca americana TaxID=7009 RepID=UPI001F4FD721|nr:cilia- and flagella-associated protein 20 isoform X1 [Schistocerca americana]